MIPIDPAARANVHLIDHPLVQHKLDSGVKKDEIPLEIEKLVRAYDPCMSCATHFLKVKWNKK